ncbi:DEAD/DEAH box helicase [Halosimplex litoreum]|uniref:DEAD/DEAH box helicase n=1 Tax=Halosimplex litoreum TaxID=1198301 RepID=A0A7U3WB94_9EURY|nr:DEAD/DEAH box helicase [Halosimplex litoreum]QPV64889.1 DEAD/DEAH box helicase [Halosimplex litoreum]
MATTDEGEGVSGPLLADGFLEDRTYQRKLADAALETHTLVCLPTGLGKTTVSLLVTADRLAGDVVNKSLLLAPTKPLVTQHAEFYREALEVPDDEIVVYTGDTRPDDRAELWSGARIVVATPEVVENDLVGNRINLTDVVHCTFDECHRATGDYAYNYIAERYHEQARDPLATGMSASPGDDEEAILEVCGNLGLAQVEVMTEDDADVATYTHETTVDWERVELPETVVEIRDAVNDVIADRLSKLRDLGVTNTSKPDVSEREIQKIQGKLRELMNNDQSEGYEGMSFLAEVRKLRTAVTYAETQSVESLRRYFERQKQAARSSGASKADQRMISEPRVREAIRRAEDYDDLHPKFRRTRMLIAQTLGIENGERVIVFTESRDTAETLTDFLGDHFTARKFVGQSDTEGSDGMTQTEQQETLDEFRAGEFEVLVSTSVAEEGLDVPEVDLVLFYEPVPTAIRAIQRKGRTGRQTEGAVSVLLAEDTRDEAYFWKARNDQKRMEKELRSLKSMAGEIESELTQTGMDEFADVGSNGEAPADANGDESLAPHETEGEPAADTSEITSEGEDAAPETEESATDSRPSSDDGEADSGDGDGQAGLDAFADRESGGGEASSGSGSDESADRDEPDGAVATASADDDESVEIVVDQRELDAAIAKDLSRQGGIVTRLETLAVGDYVLSDRVVVERKTVSDFLDTLTGDDERSLFEQLTDAARYYARPVVVVEGEDLYGERNVHPNAINGALASIAVDFGASVLRTADADETRDLLATIAAREQEDEDRTVSVHGEKSSKTLAEQQEYVVASVAEVGPVTAESLLAEFGSVEAVMTADADDLMAAEGVGEVTAERVREVVGSDYDG